MKNESADRDRNLFPTIEVKKPKPETIAAMWEARAMSTARFGSAKEVFDDLDQQAGKGKARASANKG